MQIINFYPKNKRVSEHAHDCNIQEQKKIRRKKTKNDAIFNTQNSKDKQKMRVKDDAIIKQVQIITTST